MENSNELPRGEWGSDKNILFAVRDLMAAADLEGTGVSWDIELGQLRIRTGCLMTEESLSFDSRLVRLSGGIRMHTEFDGTVDAVE